MFDPDELPPPPTLSPETYARLQKTLADKGPGGGRSALRRPARARRLQRPLLRPAHEEAGRTRRLPVPDRGRRRPAAEPPMRNTSKPSATPAGSSAASSSKRNDLARRGSTSTCSASRSRSASTWSRSRPTDADDVQPLIEVGLYHGVHPHEGVRPGRRALRHLQRRSRRTAGRTSRAPRTAKQHCIRALVRSLYDQLRERLKADSRPAAARSRTAQTVGDIVEAHPELFDEGAYHIDTSHLSSVCSCAWSWKPCPERKLARELCAYGERAERHVQVRLRPAVREHLRRLQGPARRARRGWTSRRA